MPNTPNALLAAIFDADRALRVAEEKLLSLPANRVTDALFEAIEDACQLYDGGKLDHDGAGSKASEREEATMRLERLADLCAQQTGPRAVRGLLRILDQDEHQVRVAAGEALLDVGYARYAEVAQAIEVALDERHEGPMMAELPHVLAEIGEPSALPLLKRFAGLASADAVAAAVEAMSVLGDPDAVEVLRPLTRDTRRVVFEDYENETATTIGELAREVVALFEDA